MRRGTGRGHGEWFALLDAWGATEHTHTEIARWLDETQGVPGWWTQNITVNYERARGMRSPGQMADGFSISVTRTIAVDQDRLFAAFTSAATQEALAAGHHVALAPDPRRVDVPLSTGPIRRPGSSSRSSRRARASRSSAVAHEKLPDAEAAERLKTAWRGWFGDLKTLLERP